MKEAEINDELYEAILAKKRAEIDLLDEEIVKAVTVRMAISRDIGVLKASQNTPTLDSSREQELVERAIAKGVELGLAQEDAVEIFSALFEALLKSSKEYQFKYRFNSKVD